MKVRFCENNDASALVYKRLRAEYPQLDLKRKKCLKNCGTCNSYLFARVGENYVRGKSSEDLYRQIVELMNIP